MLAKKTRKEKKEETRKLLKEAAISCFLEHGVSSTQISTITTAAGVALGTYYVHFSNKEALLDELLAEFNAGLVERLGERWFGGEVLRVEEWVDWSAGVFLSYWKEHEGFVRIYSQRAAEGLLLEQLRDGINPQAMEFLRARLAHLGEGVVFGDLVIQGLLALWLRVGLQALFHEGVTQEEARNALVLMTLGVLERSYPALFESR